MVVVGATSAPTKPDTFSIECGIKGTCIHTYSYLMISDHGIVTSPVKLFRPWHLNGSLIFLSFLSFLTFFSLFKGTRMVSCLSNLWSYLFSLYAERASFSIHFHPPVLSETATVHN